MTLDVSGNGGSSRENLGVPCSISNPAERMAGLTYHGITNKKFQLMLTRRAKVYSSSGSVV